MPSSNDVDKRLQLWRQGDFSRDRRAFIFSSSADPEEVSFEDAENGVVGMIVLTQTCDLVRPAADRPYVEVCPLVELRQEMMGHVARGTVPRYAAVPSVVGSRLVADLDRVMTVSKDVVAQWTREVGCTTDGERIAFAQKLERKRGRFAFPTDFSEGMAKFRDEIISKHSRENSSAGGIYRELIEIRILASPGWRVVEGKSIEIDFYFIVPPGLDRAGMAGHCESLIEKVNLPDGYRFSPERYQIVTLQDMLADEYVRSVPWDLEALSLG